MARISRDGEMLDAALFYAGLGWKVFPCQPRGKVPATLHGVKDASADPAQVRRWWRTMPDANIGLAAGASGLYVVDVDRDRGGLAGWRELQRQHGFDDLTVTGLTGGGGLHLVYAAPPGPPLRNSAGKLGTGIDTRGDGGYIIVPPSIHPSGQAYAWATDRGPGDLTPAPLPAPLAALLRRREDDLFNLEALPPDLAAPALPGNTDLSRPPSAPAVCGAPAVPGAPAEALRREAETVRRAPQGARNDQLNRSAFILGQLVARGQLGRAEVESALTAAARAAGLDAVEIRRTLHSGLSAGARPDPPGPPSRNGPATHAARAGQEPARVDLARPGPAPRSGTGKYAGCEGEEPARAGGYRADRRIALALYSFSEPKAPRMPAAPPPPRAARPAAADAPAQGGPGKRAARAEEEPPRADARPDRPDARRGTGENAPGEPEEPPRGDARPEPPDPPFQGEPEEHAAPEGGSGTPTAPLPSGAGSPRRAAGPAIPRVDAGKLLGMEFPEPAWAVPGLIPVGLTILAGRPKVGKSWLMLQLALAVSTGGVFLERPVQQGPCIYLALEDPPRRLQQRMQLQGWSSSNELASIATAGCLKNAGRNGITRLVAQGEFRLVVVDTLGRAVGGDQNDGEEMTRLLTPLQEAAHVAECAVVMVDHHNKASLLFGEGIEQDLTFSLSGSTAKAATSDCIISLQREKGKRGLLLCGTGRDVAEYRLRIEQDPATRCYRLLDETVAQVTDARAPILQALEQLGSATLADLTRVTRQDKSNLRQKLLDMVARGQLVCANHLYSLNRSGSQ